MWIKILKRTGTEIYAGNCLAWSASLAYYFFVALFPALLFAVALAGVLPAQPLIDQMLSALDRVAPEDVVTIARGQFRQIAAQPSLSILLLSLLGAVWSVSSGITALADTLNQTYRVTEQRPWWQVRLTAIALTLTLSIVATIAFAVVLAGPSAAERAANWLSAGPLFVWVWTIVQWPLAGGLVVVALGALYHFAPDHSRAWAWFTPGSIMGTAIWLLASTGFKVYVSHWADYQGTYGAIGGVLVTLLWFYVSSLAILLGAQLDAVIAQASGERVIPAPAH